VSMPYPGLHSNRRIVRGTVSRNYRLAVRISACGSIAWIGRIARLEVTSGTA